MAKWSSRQKPCQRPAGLGILVLSRSRYRSLVLLYSVLYIYNRMRETVLKSTVEDVQDQSRLSRRQAGDKVTNLAGTRANQNRSESLFPDRVS